jgi:hypothetical protein
MTTRKWIGIAALTAGAAILGGCADYPYYNDTYYSDGYAYRTQPTYTYPSYSYYRENPGYWYGPGYYVAPSVGFGVTYSSRPYYYRGRWYG